jgi:methyl-accepting chemotaxis protein
VSVRQLKSLFGIDRLSILQRVSSGMGIILLLLVGLSINSRQIITAVHDKAQYVNSSMGESAAVTEFAALVGETRARVTQYALSENDSDLRSAQRALDQLQNQIRSVVEAYALEGVDNVSIDQMRGLADQYRNSVTATIDAINIRRSNSADLVQSGTELSTTIAAIVEALAHDASNAGALDDAIRLMEAFHIGNASATRFLASRNPADSDTTRVDLQAMSESLRALQARDVDNRRVQRFLKAMAEPFERYERAVNGLAAATKRFAHVTVDRNTATSVLIAATDQMRWEATEAQLGMVRGMTGAVTSARDLNYLVSALAIVAGLMLASVIGRGIARPIQQMTTVMRDLARGRIDVVIPYLGYRNEIGDMAEAVRVFRDNKIEADRLMNENEAARQGREQRTRSLEAFNRRFESTAAALTSTLSSAAAGLKQSAEAMFATTEQAGERSGTVKVAAQQASANIETVAHAAEELSASIDAIGDSAYRSYSLSTKTTEGAHSANRAVQQLAEDAREIERVVSLIRQVAQQTNLLALNATIEAARAGEMGRGFAVVAGEVKALAAQTATATDEIETQISRIQSVIATVVTAIQDIVSKIGEMNEIATSVSAAVDQQRGATRTIAQNAQQATSIAVEVVHAIASIESASATTKIEANQVLDAAGQLSRQSDDLHIEFDRFIADVRSA